MKVPRAADVADLLRLPAVLTVPGDVLLGDAVSGRRRGTMELAGLVGASSCLYLSGMALNDYADREVDAEERPARPIPSGRVSPCFALGLAAGLSAAGLGLARLAGGRRALLVAVPLAATVWAYDLVLKETPLGPLAMAAARSLDVAMGASDLRVLPALAVVGGHTVKITAVSRHEARGGTKSLAAGSLLGTAAVAASTLLAVPREPGLTAGIRRIVATALLGAHAASMARAEAAAVKEPNAANLRRVVGKGVLGLMPLEAGICAGKGALGRSALLAAGWTLARRLARERSVT